MSNYQVSKRLSGHTAAVVSLVVIEESESLLSAGYDQNILIWNLADGQIIQKIQSHKSSVTCLCLTSDK
jgi:WD40 repeat protein